MANLVQADRGFTTFDSIVPSATGLYGVDDITASYLVPVGNLTMITCTRPLRLTGLIGRVDVVGSDAGAVTFAFWKAASGVAPASGILVHTGTMNLKGTVNTNQVLALATAETTLQFDIGDSLIAVLTGVGTAAKGTVTATFAWR